MTQRKRAGRRRERGIALVAVLLVLVLMLGIGAAFHTTVINDVVARGANLRAAQGFYASEAGINLGMGTYRNIFLNYAVPAGNDFNPYTFNFNHRTVTYQLSNVAGNPFTVIVPAGRNFAGLNATEYRYTADSNSQLNLGDVEADVGTQFNVDYIPIFQFLAFYQRDLEIEPGPNATFHGPIHTNGNVYLNSGATLTICDCTAGVGPGQCSPNAIPIVHISAAGNVYRGRKDTSSCAGTVQVSRLVDADHNGLLDLQTLACAGGATTQESSATLSTWLGSILARQPAVAVPQPSALNRLTGQYWQSADLRIVLDTDSPDAQGLFPIVVQNADGTVNAAQNALLQTFMTLNPGRIFYNDVPTAGNRNPSASANCTLPQLHEYCDRRSYAPNFVLQGQVYACPTSSLGLYPGCANIIGPTVLSTGGNTFRRGGFYNNREQQWVYMLNVNIHDLLAFNRQQGGAFFPPDITTDGGDVIFLSVKGSGAFGNSVGVGSPRYGVRVFGSPNLDFAPGAVDPTGLTVVSDNAVYVEGNYNNGTGVCTFGNGVCPWMPAAFFGDTINVLSANWSSSAVCRNDCQSFQALAARPAVSTVINAAFLGGVDDTAVGAYNGGLENYPRFHEDWSAAGTTLTYRGSFVSLGTPQHNNGAWCGTGAACNIYNPPVRNWDFDTNFLTAANLPPITPRFVTVQQILFTENFR
jgi:hypothetical protein